MPEVEVPYQPGKHQDTAPDKHRLLRPFVDLHARITRYPANGDRVRVYFPVSNQVVEIDSAAQADQFLAQVGWIGGDLDVLAPVRLSKASFVEEGPDYQALTMVFPGTLFKMPRTAGDLFLTIHLDETGKALSLEQLTLGMRAVSTVKYPEVLPARIREQSPRIPARAVTVAISSGKKKMAISIL